MGSRRLQSGYILIETTVAILILGISAVTVHGVVRQAILTRGQAQDYTLVRYLLEDFMARAKLQPLLLEGPGGGIFDDGSRRFSYSYNIRSVTVSVKSNDVQNDGESVPGLAAGSAQGLAPGQFGADEFGQPIQNPKPESGPKLAHIEVTAYWSRGGMEFSETLETLLPKDKLYEPPKVIPKEEGFRNAV